MGNQSPDFQWHLFFIEVMKEKQLVCAVHPQHTFSNSIFILFDAVLLFIVPFAALAVCYKKILTCLTKIRISAEVLQPTKHFYAQHTANMKMLIVILIVLAVCSFPPYSFELYLFFHRSRISGVGFVFSEVEQGVYLVYYTNS